LNERRCEHIEELRVEARQRLPRAVLDFIDGAAEDEATLDRNRQALEQSAFSRGYSLT